MIDFIDLNLFGFLFVVSGLVCDRNLSLGHLIGVLNDFFSRLGTTNFLFNL